MPILSGQLGCSVKRSGKEIGMKNKSEVTLDGAAADSIQTTVGIGLGDRWSHHCVVDRSGEIIEEVRVRTTANFSIWSS
jgi:hypothetical protein